LILLLMAGWLAGCGGDAPQTDLTDKAASLSRLISAGDDHVEVPTLADWIIRDQREFVLVDIRDGKEFTAGHIEGAKNIPLGALFSEQSLASLPAGRKIVVYSNGSAHAAQAALLLRLTGREALALLGGYNYWQAYMHDPQAAGVAEMDALQHAEYQAVACRFAGDYVASAGLPSADTRNTPSEPAPGDTGADALGLGLGLGSESIQQSQQPPSSPPAQQADPLGLGLGLGSDAIKSSVEPKESEPGKTRKLLIRAEC
jgi:rhodanese-related sulfurtransferase